MTRPKMFNYAILILSNVILTSIVQAFPETLSVTMKNVDEHLKLEWKYTQQYLANENLPIWYAWKNQPPVLQPNVMTNIGPFAMYHDIDKSSAVVYFQDIDRIFGVIDTRFIIYDLPLSEIQSGTYQTVDGPYVKRRQISSHHDDLMEFLYDNVHPSPRVSSLLPDLSTLTISETYSSTNHQDGHVNSGQKHHQESNVLFPEMLIFISNDIVKGYKTVMALVAFYLTHLNAVDMLFAKLASDGVVIHINIAGLVLEAEENVFPLIFDIEKPPNVIDGPDTLDTFVEYLKQYADIFVEDSFDFFFLSTQHNVQFGENIVDGLSRMNLNVYEMRSSKSYSGSNYDVAGTVIRIQKDHGDFVACAHEFAHLMQVDHDPVHAGKHCFDVQCHGILQTIASYCKDCIVWSAKSRKEFQTYVRTNKNRCFLLNHPRSLLPYGVPMKTIGPRQQCVCYGYESHWMFGLDVDHISGHSCEKKLTCAIRNREVHGRNPKPIDGTPCGRNKVCWKGRCQSLVGKTYYNY